MAKYLTSNQTSSEDVSLDVILYLDNQGPQPKKNKKNVVQNLVYIFHTQIYRSVSLKKWSWDNPLQLVEIPCIIFFIIELIIRFISLYLSFSCSLIPSLFSLSFPFIHLLSLMHNLPKIIVFDKKMLTLIAGGGGISCYVCVFPHP